MLTTFFRILMVRIRARAAILFLLLPYAGCALAQSAPGFPSRPWHAALITSRDRVQELKSAGKSALEAVAEKPFADLDPVWGKGIINGD